MCKHVCARGCVGATTYDILTTDYYDVYVKVLLLEPREFIIKEPAGGCATCSLFPHRIGAAKTSREGKIISTAGPLDSRILAQCYPTYIGTLMLP